MFCTTYMRMRHRVDPSTTLCHGMMNTKKLYPRVVAKGSRSVPSLPYQVETGVLPNGRCRMHLVEDISSHDIAPCHPAPNLQRETEVNGACACSQHSIGDVGLQTLEDQPQPA
ncbi:hypothetical protein PMIN03_000206 [Paraphaeosphaeria minitans]